MKTPTLEEVKEHFKDAKIVRYLIGTNESQIIPDSIFTDGHDFYAHRIDGEGHIKLWSPNGYAEIVEYKDEYLKGIQDKYYNEHVGIRKEAFEKGGITHKGDEDTIMPNFKLTADRNIKYLDMESNKNKTPFTMTFETVGAVQVSLTSKNIDNLVTIANMIK